METDEQSESSLRSVALILLCCGAVKMLHLLGVISVEGECDRGFLATRCALSAPWRDSRRDKIFASALLAVKNIFSFHCFDYFKWLYLIKVYDGNVF